MIPGFCLGSTVGNVADIGDPYECLSFCKDSTNCNWFTYNPTQELCSLHPDCYLDAESCPECVSGELNQNDMMIRR